MRRRLRTTAARLCREVLRVPRRLRVAGLGVALVAAAFTATIGAFIAQQRSTVERAEVTGRIPADAVAERQVTLLVGVDNTGDVVVHRLCVVAHFDRTVSVRDVVFAGVDHAPFVGDRACGGRLTGSETVSVALEVVAPSPGPLKISLAAADNQLAIGPALVGTVTVRAP